MRKLFEKNHTDGFFDCVLRRRTVIYVVRIIVAIHAYVPEFRLNLGATLTRLIHTYVLFYAFVCKVFVRLNFFRFFFSYIQAHLAQVADY